MFIFFIAGLLLGCVAVIFALQNIAAITVSFFTWQLHGSLALILFLAVLVGILIALLIILPDTISNYFKYRALQKENKALQEELRKQKELTVFAKNVPPSPEVLTDIQNGEVGVART